MRDAVPILRDLAAKPKSNTQGAIARRTKIYFLTVHTTCEWLRRRGMVTKVPVPWARSGFRQYWTITKKGLAHLETLDET